jgi:hypothetical protein
MWHRLRCRIPRSTPIRVQPLHVFLTASTGVTATSTKRDSADYHGFHLVTCPRLLNVLPEFTLAPLFFAMRSCEYSHVTGSRRTKPSLPSQPASSRITSRSCSPTPQLASVTALAITLNFKNGCSSRDRPPAFNRFYPV